MLPLTLVTDFLHWCSVAVVILGPHWILEEDHRVMPILHLRLDGRGATRHLPVTQKETEDEQFLILIPPVRCQKQLVADFLHLRSHGAAVTHCLAASQTGTEDRSWRSMFRHVHVILILPFRFPNALVGDFPHLRLRVVGKRRLPANQTETEGRSWRSMLRHVHAILIPSFPHLHLGVVRATRHLRAIRRTEKEEDRFLMRIPSFRWQNGLAAPLRC
jgi:hypothetical protein